MAVRFRVASTFNLSSLNHFVIIGEVLEGTPKPGMRVPVPPHAPLGCSGRVIGVESIDNLRDRIFLTGLRVAYSSPDELSFWESLPLPGSEIRLLPEAGPAG